MRGPEASGGGRFQDATTGFVSFALDDIHVVCPKCSARAVVTTPVTAAGDEDCPYPLRRVRELVCHGCLHRARSGSTLYCGDRGRDPFFDAELWLTTGCCGRTLWAFNAQHLEFLDHYVRAELREHVRNAHRSVTLGERLPSWMTSRKNRGEVLKGIDRLRRKLNGEATREDPRATR